MGFVQTSMIYEIMKRFVTISSAVWNVILTSQVVGMLY